MHDLATLIVELRPSRLLLLVSGGVHGLAGAAVVVSSTPLWVKSGFIAGIVLSMVWIGLRYGYRRGRGFIRRIELLDGRWRLETGGGNPHRAQFSGGYAHPQVVILNFRLENGRRRSLTLLPDSADADALRELRVWLRTRREADEADGP